MHGERKVRGEEGGGGYAVRGGFTVREGVHGEGGGAG